MRGPYISARSPEEWRNRGFTLVEMLVVLALLGILATLVVGGVQNTDFVKLRSAQDMLISQTQAARSLALAKNTASRLLIDAGSDEENGRRRLALASLSQEEPGKWEVAAIPVRLPEATAFLADDGETPASTGGGSASPPGKLSGSSLIGPESLKQTDWFFIEFDSAGTCEDSAGAILIVGSVRHDGSRWVRKSVEMIRGVMLRRSGYAGVFADPAHIREAYGAL